MPELNWKALGADDSPLSIEAFKGVAGPDLEGVRRMAEAHFPWLPSVGPDTLCAAPVTLLYLFARSRTSGNADIRALAALYEAYDLRGTPSPEQVEKDLYRTVPIAVWERIPLNWWVLGQREEPLDVEAFRAHAGPAPLQVSEKLAVYFPWWPGVYEAIEAGWLRDAAPLVALHFLARCASHGRTLANEPVYNLGEAYEAYSLASEPHKAITALKGALHRELGISYEPWTSRTPRKIHPMFVLLVASLYQARRDPSRIEVRLTPAPGNPLSEAASAGSKAQPLTARETGAPSSWPGGTPPPAAVSSSSALVTDLLAVMRSYEQRCVDGFAGRQDALDILSQTIRNETAGAAIFVTGPRGQGKTWLMCRLTAKLREEGFPCLIHLAEVSSDPSRVLESLIAQATLALEEDVSCIDVGGSLADLRVRLEAFLIRLYDKTRRRVVVAIDGLDHLSPEHADLHFLPSRLPGGACCLLSYRSDHSLPSVRERIERIALGYELPSLSSEDFKLLRECRLEAGTLSALDRAGALDWEELLHRSASNARLLSHHLDLIASVVSRDGARVFAMTEFMPSIEEEFAKWLREAGCAGGQLRTQVLHCLCVARAPLAGDELLLLVKFLSASPEGVGRADVLDCCHLLGAMVHADGHGWSVRDRALAEYVTGTLEEADVARLHQAFCRWLHASYARTGYPLELFLVHAFAWRQHGGGVQAAGFIRTVLTDIEYLERAQDARLQGTLLRYARQASEFLPELHGWARFLSATQDLSGGQMVQAAFNQPPGSTVATAADRLRGTRPLLEWIDRPSQLSPCLGKLRVGFNAVLATNGNRTLISTPCCMYSVNLDAFDVSRFWAGHEGPARFTAAAVGSGSVFATAMQYHWDEMDPPQDLPSISQIALCWRWENQLSLLTFSLSSGDGAVVCLALTEDSRFLVAGTDAGSLFAWPLPNLNQHITDELDIAPYELLTSQGPVRGLAVLPDCQHAVCATSDTLYLLSLEDCQLLKSEPCGSPIAALSVSPDGRFVVAAQGCLAHLVTLPDLDARPIWRSPVEVTALALHPDGQRLLLANSLGEIWLTDLGTIADDGDVTTEVFARLDGHAEAVTSLAVVASGREALSTDATGIVRRWDLTTEQDAPYVDPDVPLYRQRYPGCVGSEDGRQVAVFGRERFVITDCEQKASKIVTLAATSCVLTHDLQQVVSLYPDPESPGLRHLYFRALDARGSTRLTLASSMLRLTGASTRDGDQLVAWLLRLTDSSLLNDHQREHVDEALRAHWPIQSLGQCEHMRSPDARVTWDLLAVRENGEFLLTRSWTGHVFDPVVVSPDGERVMLGSEVYAVGDGWRRVASLDIAWDGPPAPRLAAFSRDARKLLLGGWYNPLYVADLGVRTPRIYRLEDSHGGHAERATITGDGKHVLSFASGILSAWSAETGSLLAELPFDPPVQHITANNASRILCVSPYVISTMRLLESPSAVTS